MGWSLLGSSVLGISQARILEWIAISFSRASSRSWDQAHVSYFAGRFFTARDHRSIKRRLPGCTARASAWMQGEPLEAEVQGWSPMFHAWHRLSSMWVFWGCSYLYHWCFPAPCKSSSMFALPFSFLSFWQQHGAAYGVLVLPPGIEPMSPAVEVWSLNPWTTREVLSLTFYLKVAFTGRDDSRE